MKNADTVAMSFAVCIAFMCISPSFSQTIEKRGGEVIIDITKHAWESGAQKRAYIADAQTPDQERVLGLEIMPAGKTVYVNGPISSNFLAGVKTLPGSWEQMSFWLKPDGSGASVVLTFHSKNPDAKTVQSTYTIKLIGSEWQKIETKNLWHSDAAGLQLNNMVNISFDYYGKERVGLFIGPIHFKFKGVAALTPVKTFSISTAAAAPKIDGALNDECWKNAAAIDSFDIPYGTNTAPAKVKLCFDADAVYLGFRQTIDTAVLKKEQTSPEGTIWADDCFELLLSPGDDGRTYHQFIVNAINTRQTYHLYFDQIKDGFTSARNLFAGKWASAVVVEKDHWSVELKVPRGLVKDLDKKVHGMQLSVTRTGRWADAVNNISPSHFGVLFLDDGTGNAPSSPLKDVALDLQGKAPALTFGTVPGSAYAIEAQLSTPDGTVTTGRGMVKDGSLRFDGYSPKSGIQRLVLSMKEGNGQSAVYAFMTAPMVFSVKIPYGNVVLTPVPKKWVKKSGVFSVTGGMRIFTGAKSGGTFRTAERLRDDCLGFLQTPLAIETANGMPENTIVIGEAPTATDTGVKSVPEKDGYILDIAETSILLSGNTPAGLLYAAVTLSQLERYAFLKNERALPCGRVEDWPALPHRAWVSWHDILYSMYTEKTKGADAPGEILAGLYDIIDRLAIGSKMNFVSIMNPTSIRHENAALAQFSDRNAYMSIRDLAAMAGHCREHFVEFAPGLHGPSHANWLTSKCPELIMPGYNNYDANPVDPKFFEHYLLMQNELIKATTPMFFHGWKDEWWHLPNGEMTTVYAGREKRDIFYDTIMRINGSLKEQGVRMMMFSDMLQQTHNGGKPYDNHLNLERMPRDIVMMHWSGGEAAVRQFGELGFSSWYVGNKSVDLNPVKVKDRRHLSGIGVINYDSIAPAAGYGAAGMLKTADLAWNFWDGVMGLDDWMNQNGANIMAMMSVRPNPAASQEFVPLDITSACNDSYRNAASGFVIEGLPQGAATVGFIPSVIVPSAGGRCMVRGGEASAVIPVDRKAAAIIFLHTQHCPREKQKEFIASCGTRKSGSYNGLKTGVYMIEYVDGQRAPVYIRNTVNCGNVRPFPGRVTGVLENKYLLDVRFVWEGKDDGGEACLYQYEWVNSRPDVAVKSIAFSSMMTTAVPYLFAVTVRIPRAVGQTGK